MKGVILAGGTGSRLYPLTRVTNKHLLPVYDKPMIYYPLMTLKEAGLKDIMIVSGKEHVGDFSELLGSGKDFGVSIRYEVQEEAGGIAQALSLTEDFVGKDKCVCILGDNIFEDSMKVYVEQFGAYGEGAMVILKEVENPCSYGVARVEDGSLMEIVEKPDVPPSNLAVTGLYMYDHGVFGAIRGLEPSTRGELEITDVNNYYIGNGHMRYAVLKSFWGDCGESFDGLLEVAQTVKDISSSSREHKGISAGVKHHVPAWSID